MSALQKLKAYFGMVPSDGLDDIEDMSDLDVHPADSRYRDFYVEDHGEPAYPAAGGYQNNRARSSASRFGYERSGWDASDEGNIEPSTDPHRPFDASGARSDIRQLGRGSDAHRGNASEGHRGMDSRRRNRSAEGAGIGAGQGVAARNVDSARDSHRESYREGSRDTQLSRIRAVTDTGSQYNLSKITTLHPRSYGEARTIGEQYREGTPVIINLTEMEEDDAKRLVDFAAGLAFGLRGSIDKVTSRVFLLSPPNVDVAAEERRRLAEGTYFNYG